MWKEMKALALTEATFWWVTDAKEVNCFGCQEMLCAVRRDLRRVERAPSWSRGQRAP